MAKQGIQQEAPAVNTDVRDFGGLTLQADPHDLEVGYAQDQVNIASDQQGVMQVRMGSRSLTFDAITP